MAIGSINSLEILKGGQASARLKVATRASASFKPATTGNSNSKEMFVPDDQLSHGVDHLLEP